MDAIISDIMPRYHSFEDHLDRNLRLKPVVTLTTEIDLGTVFGGQYDIIRLCELCFIGSRGISAVPGGDFHYRDAENDLGIASFLWEFVRRQFYKSPDGSLQHSSRHA